MTPITRSGGKYHIEPHWGPKLLPNNSLDVKISEWDSRSGSILYNLFEWLQNGGKVRKKGVEGSP